MPETMPTISASIEMHQNKIAQSRAINASSGNSGSGSNAISRGRRRPLNRSNETHSRFNCCFNSVFCTRKCNWRCNQRCCTNCWSTIACCCWWKWCCRRKCCARFCCGCNDNDDSENDDDDIDAKFEQYKYEMRLNELKREHCDRVNEEQETSLQLNSYCNDALPPLPLPTTTTTTIAIHDQKTSNDGNAINDAIVGKTVPTKTTSKIFRYRKYWNWNTNDSLRSNSDKFLETLEYDMDGEQSLNRANNKYKRTDASARTKGYIPDLHVSLTYPPAHRTHTCSCTVDANKHTAHSTWHTNVLMWQHFLYFSSAISSFQNISLHFFHLSNTLWRRLLVVFLFRFPSLYFVATLVAFDPIKHLRFVFGWIRTPGMTHWDAFFRVWHTFQVQHIKTFIYIGT